MTYHINSQNRKLRVDDDTFSALGGSNKEFRPLVLLSNQWSYVCFEQAGSYPFSSERWRIRKTWKQTETHYDKSNGKSAHYTVLMLVHTCNGANDEHNVSNKCNNDRNADGFEPSPVCIGDIGAEQRRHITPTIRHET